jgi:hypothetical protein
MINAINISILRNAEYIQFAENFSDLVKSNDPEVLSVVTQFNVFNAKNTELKSLFKLQLSSDVTEEIQGLDLRRDNAINGITAVVTGFMYHFDPAKSSVANVLNENLKLYGVGIARENYQAETALINSIVSDWESKPNLIAAVSALNLNDWKEELKASNSLFDKKYLERTKEYGSANEETLKKKREETNAAYYELRKHIDAHGVINNSTVYTKTIKELNALIEQYNTVLNSRLAVAKKN